MSGIRALHLRGALGAVRTEMWNGREHLVVPVVALQEAAIHAVNAKNREFVPASTLSNSVGRWNGHPLVVGHPTKDGHQISAHDDSVLAQHGFGFIRQAAMNGKRLGMEAMVDTARLVALKQDQLLADLRAGKNIEVSVGAYVTTNDKRGTFDGRDWDGEWMEITPDHLAFLPGGTGACSIAMGCGAHRAAEAYLVTAEGFEALGGEGSGWTAENGHVPGSQGGDPKAFSDPKTETRPQGTVVAKSKYGQVEVGYPRSDGRLGEKVYYTGRRKNGESTGSVNSVQAAMDRLREPVNRDMFPSGHRLEDVEWKAPKVKGLSMNLNDLKAKMLALFDTPEEEEAELVVDTEQLKALYGKTISAATMKTVQSAHDASHDMHTHTIALGAECSGMKVLASKSCEVCEGLGQVSKDEKQEDCPACGGSGELKAAERSDDAAKGEVMTKEERATMITALAACGCSGHKGNIKALEAKSDETLEALNVAMIANKTAEDAAKAEADAKLTAADTKVKTLEAKQTEVDAKLAAVQPIVAEYEARVAAEKTSLIKTLEASKVLTAAELETKTLGELQTLAKFAKVETPVDYSGRGVAVPRAAQSGEDFTPPNPYEAPLKALSAKVN